MSNEKRVRITLEIDCGTETLESVMASIQEFVTSNGDIWDWDVKGTEEFDEEETS